VNPLTRILILVFGTLGAVACLMGVFVQTWKFIRLWMPASKPKPRPWEDPDRPAWNREAWRKSEPKSLRRSA
jgi:hypothetical protein